MHREDLCRADGTAEVMGETGQSVLSASAVLWVVGTGFPHGDPHAVCPRTERVLLNEKESLVSMPRSWSCLGFSNPHPVTHLNRRPPMDK